MTSGYMPPKGEPDPDEILDALREALAANPRLAEMSEEEVARQLVLEERLEKEPSVPLVAEALQAIEAEEGESIPWFLSSFSRIFVSALLASVSKL